MNKSLLFLWPILLFSSIGMPLVSGQIPGDIQGCEVVYMSDYFYRPIRINMIHDLGSSTVQRIYDNESKQQITIEEPLVPSGDERTNIGFWSNSTGHMIAKVVIEHKTEKQEPRKVQINIQSAGGEMSRSIIEYTGTKYCRVFDMTIKEQILPISDEEILQVAGEITNQRFEQTGEKMDKNTAATNQAVLVGGISAAIVTIVGIAIWLSRKSDKKLLENSINDYKLMKQEYANMIQTSTINEMHKELEMVNYKQQIQNAIQYFNNSGEKLLDELKVLINIAFKQKETREEKVEEKIESKSPIQSQSFQQKFMDKVKGALPEKKQTEPSIKFKQELDDKIKEMDPAEQVKFLNETYVSLYPKTREELENVSAELNERLYIVKHLLSEISSTEYE